MTDKRIDELVEEALDKWREPRQPQRDHIRSILRDLSKKVQSVTCPDCGGKGTTPFRARPDIERIYCLTCGDGESVGTGKISERHAGWLEADEWSYRNQLAIRKGDETIRCEAARRFGKGE